MTFPKRNCINLQFANLQTYFTNLQNYLSLVLASSQGKMDNCEIPRAFLKSLSKNTRSINSEFPGDYLRNFQEMSLVCASAFFPS